MGKMLKIMLAQDTDTQTGCAAALRANGFEVETVRKDGAQILRLFRQEADRTCSSWTRSCRARTR